jgi:hypothetical protein
MHFLDDSWIQYSCCSITAFQKVLNASYDTYIDADVVTPWTAIHIRWPFAKKELLLPLIVDHRYWQGVQGVPIYYILWNEQKSPRQLTHGVWKKRRMNERVASCATRLSNKLCRMTLFSARALDGCNRLCDLLKGGRLADYRMWQRIWGIEEKCTYVYTKVRKSTR